ncbi:hypothetical protein ACTHGU_04865 [Chitinophagaceae bacterium MMS25-I14]
MVLIILCNEQRSNAQGVLPVHRYIVAKTLDKITTASSFGYSLRRVKNSYAGYAVRIRRGTDNAEADVDFDATGIVSTASNVKVTAKGSSSLTVGQTLTYSSFKGSQTIYVKTWYDQGATAYHATQTTTASQPMLVLGSAGGSNTKPSVVFSGSQYLDVGQPIQNLTNNGINGSFLLWMKPTANTNQESFGHWQTTWTATNWRWSFHVNWSDGYLYFDAAENCCAANRSVNNATNINLYKQYSFVRGTAYKTVRINSAATSLNNTTAPSVSASGGSFYIGWATNGSDAAYSGSVCELFMFPTDLAVNNLQALETDQIAFWSN